MSEAVTVRLASAADVPAIRALVEAAYRGDSARRGWTHEADLIGGQRIDEAEIDEILSDPRQRLLLAEADGVAAGCVKVSDQGSGLAYLGLLSVDPERQAAGLGRRLIAAAEREAVRSFGARAMEMTVIRQRPELVAYYERRGYVRTEEERPFHYGNDRIGIPTRGDLSFVVLSKPLG